MKSKGVDIFQEPIGDTYRALINFAFTECDTFSLVWQEGFDFTARADLLAERLSPYIQRSARTDSWPGTQIFDRFALVRWYRLCVPTGHILKEAPGLYSWLAPDFPEDLAFFKRGKCWMASLSHEQCSWFTISAPAPLMIKRAIPTLVISS